MFARWRDTVGNRELPASLRAKVGPDGVSSGQRFGSKKPPVRDPLRVEGTASRQSLAPFAFAVRMCRPVLLEDAAWLCECIEEGLSWHFALGVPGKKPTVSARFVGSYSCIALVVREVFPSSINSGELDPHVPRVICFSGDAAVQRGGTPPDPTCFAGSLAEYDTSSG
jgi:hypothetical protein